MKTEVQSNIKHALKIDTHFTRFGVYFGGEHLIDFEDDGDKQCIEINALLSEELMLFQHFCCSGVGRYQPVQAHLCIRATTFYALPVPLPRQVFMYV